MKLTTLKPRLQPIGQRLKVVQAQPHVVARKRGSAGVKDRDRIRERDCNLCQECKRQGRTSIGTDVDHIKPLIDGGDDTDANKELLCFPCHSAKSAREARQRARGW